jgi:hypothetical protein
LDQGEAALGEGKFGATGTKLFFGGRRAIHRMDIPFLSSRGQGFSMSGTVHG